MTSMEPDGEDLSDSEELSITVDFLKLKSLETLKTLKKIIPRDLRDDRGNTLLHWAASKGQLEKAKYLVQTMNRTSNPSDTRYESPYADRAIPHQGRSKVIWSWLVSQDAVNALGENALEVASRAGFTKVIEFFVSVGLSCEVKDPQLRLNPEVSIEAEKQLSGAIYADNLEVLQVVWNAYVRNPQGRFSIPEHYEWTALEMAANFLSPKALEFFVQKGCCLASQSRDSGYTPIRSVFSLFLENLPPENDKEWTMTNVGCDCVLFILSLHVDLSDYSRLISQVKERLALVGEYDRAASAFERDVVRKVDRLRLALAQL